MGLDRVRLGIVGSCGRGAAFKGVIDRLKGVEVAAVCDIDAAGVQGMARQLRAEKWFTEYEPMLEHGGVNAVILGTPMPLHVQQSVMALQRGIGVLSEVPAGVSVEECQQLVLACRRSSAVYMMAENYIYSRQNLLVAELVRRGMFGEVYFAEGEYIHELKPLNEKTRWRRKWQTGINGVTYGTHSLGPILQWMPGDRVAAVCCAGSGHHYKDALGQPYENQDSTLMLCRMARGGLVKVRVDMLSERPHAMTNYQLQGTEGCYESARAEGETDRIWLKQRGGGKYAWEDLRELEREHFSAEQRAVFEMAATMGHGGGDYLEMVDFVAALRGEKEPKVGIDAAMDMTLPGLISQLSIAQRGEWLNVADSRAWKTAENVRTGSLHMVMPAERLKNCAQPPLPEGYCLRQYEHRDEPQWAALMEQGELGQWDHQRVAALFASTLQDGMFVVEHVASGAIAATAMAVHNPSALHPHGGELAWVAADARHRGNGLGRVVCSAVVNLFARRGYKRVYLMTDDFRLPAIRVYLGLGFEPAFYAAMMKERWATVREALGLRGG